MWTAKNPIELMKTFRNKQRRDPDPSDKGWEEGGWGGEGGGHPDREISGRPDLKIKISFHVPQKRFLNQDFKVCFSYIGYKTFLFAI